MSDDALAGTEGTEGTSTLTTRPAARTGFVLARAALEVAAEDTGTTIPLRDATGEPMTFGDDAKPVTLTVAGTYSSVYRKAERAFNTKISKQKRGGTGIADLMDQRSLELTAACVLAWDGFWFDGDRPLPLTLENVLTVFSQARWIYDQAFDASNDHAGFFKPSSSP